MIKHGWHNHGRTAIILKTTRTGSFGVWPELTGFIFRQWLEPGIRSEDGRHRFGWVREPYRDSITKIHRAFMRNKFGGESEIVLFPIEHPGDALDKLLSTEWSCVWLCEGHLYKDTKDAKARDIFDTALGQLRLKGVPFENTRLFVDTNPPVEGTKHWLYDIFFRERTMDEWPEYFTEETIAAFRERQSQMEVVPCPLESNTFLHPGLKQQLISQYAWDPFLYRRFVLGEWIDGATTGVFEKSFRRDIHVVGSVEHKNREEWEVIQPVNSVDCVLEGGLPLLIGGWDVGDVNHAWVCVQPVWDQDDKLQFRVIAEHVLVRAEVSVEEFAQQVAEKMREVEKLAGFQVVWRHFSDASAFEFRAAIRRQDLPDDADLCDAAIVEAVTGIMLEGAADVKKPGWQRQIGRAHV